ITEKSGSKKINGYDITFNENADFIIKINSKDDAQILVNEYYDICENLFNNKISTNKSIDKFNVIKQKILRTLTTPVTNRVIEEKEVEVGKLIYGNSNPKSEEFNSLADFIIEGDDIEIRIPWLMLNVSNPAKKLILDDFNINNKINFIEIDDIKVGAYLIEEKKCSDVLEMKSYFWDKWDLPVYHERLKKSYYIIKEAFENIS
ncbi:MAG: family 2 glycosyl transferase, partial [Cellulosilyticaceae bacterium]